MICFLCVSVYSSFAQDNTQTSEQETAVENTAMEATKEENKVPSWFVNNVNVVWSQNTRYGPSPANSLYLEYELMGRQGIFDFYGYVDIPKTFGIGNDNIRGIWQKGGSRLFADLQGRMSINGLLGKGQNDSFLKEYFVALNYIGNFGKSKDFASGHSLWYGLGATVNTYSKLNLNVNFYLRKTFTNYGSGNEHSWRGYRVKLNWNYPICSLFNGNGSLTYVGFGDYDFGLDKRPKDRPSNDIGSNNALQVSTVLNVSYKKFHIAPVARYWYHGGENRYNGGSFPVRTSGWGYYIVAGVQL